MKKKTGRYNQTNKQLTQDLRENKRNTSIFREKAKANGFIK